MYMPLTAGGEYIASEHAPQPGIRVRVRPVYPDEDVHDSPSAAAEEQLEQEAQQATVRVHHNCKLAAIAVAVDYRLGLPVLFILSCCVACWFSVDRVR